MQLGRNGAGESIGECCKHGFGLYDVNDFSGSAVVLNARAGARLSLVRPEALRRMRVFHCCTCKSYVSKRLCCQQPVSYSTVYRAKKERRAVYLTEDVFVPTGIQHCTVLWTTKDVCPCACGLSVPSHEILGR